MDLSQRRSIQRKDWLGLGSLLLLLLLGITLFTVSISLFFAVLIGLLLVGAFVVGFTLLFHQLAAHRAPQLAPIPIKRGSPRLPRR